MYVFGSGSLVAVPQFDASGVAIAAADRQPVKLGALQDVSLDISVDMKMLYGAKRFPLAVGQGKGKIDVKAKYANISGRAIGSLFYGKNATNAIKGIATVAGSVPATSVYTVTPTVPSSGTWVADLGVYNATTGAQLKRVTSAPSAGQYSVSAGVYTFAAADASAAMLFDLEYSATSTTAELFNLTNDVMGFTPSFSMYLEERAPTGGKLTVCLFQAVSGKLSLPFKSDDFAVSDFEASAFANSADALGWICLEGA
jgi:hypothetical protein